MSNNSVIKNTIDFEVLKKQKSASEIELKIHEQWLIAHPNSAKAQQVVAEEKEKIIKLNILLEQEPPLPEKNSIDFEELKKQKKSYVIDVEVHEEWLALHPNNNESQRIVAETKQKITEIDTLLQKEPPIPELPPSQPLIKIGGILEEINTLYARGYFSDREYDLEGFARKEANRQWGSVILAMIGQSAAAAVNSQDELRNGDNYYFVQGKMDGVSFYGWLGRTTAKPGDYVELVAIKKIDHYEVYALAIPELRVVSIIPDCYQGIRSRGKSEVKGCFILFLSLILILLFSFTVIGNAGIKEIWGLSIYFGGMLTVGAVLAIGIYIHSIKKPRPSTILAQEIITVLGIADSKNIHLGKKTKEKVNKIRKRNIEKNHKDRIMPSKHYFIEHYYYY